VSALLEAEGVAAFYGDFQALFGIDLEIGEGERIAIIGANGAGKSTFLKTVTGLLPLRHGSLRFAGSDIAGVPAHRLVALGIAMVPEGRRLFASLSVEENLAIGAYGRRPGRWNLGLIYRLFPVLAERRAAPAKALSGGQQQMCAIGRALMANPSLLLCDELSLGLAPIVIKDIYAALASIAGEGTTIVVVEQDINQAMAMADRLYCFQEGRVALEGRPGALTRERISAAYFGL